MTDVIIDYRGERGDRLLARRETDGVPPSPVHQISGEITAFWDSAEFTPNTLLIERRFFMRLARRMMTRRGFRRWRGRLKARRP